VKTKYKSKIFAAIHETAEDFYSGGLIDAKTMRDFDKSCLEPIKPLTPSEIAEARTTVGVSQNVFAHYLNVSVGSISQWERGEKHPSGPALKLLDLLRRKGLEVLA
jgi:putative transcriptional regulator